MANAVVLKNPASATVLLGLTLPEARELRLLLMRPRPTDAIFHVLHDAIKELDP